MTNTVTSNINAVLDLPAPPAADVDSEGGSVTSDPETGEVTIMFPASGATDTTLSREVSCDDASTPTNVTLILEDESGNPLQSYTMTETPPASGTYQATIPAADIANATVNVSWECNGTPEEEEVGEIVLYDPSGYITDGETGEPIKGATVTLYRIPNWLPDTDTETRNCRTVNTRNGADWGNEPDASIDLGVLINPALNPTEEISPTINPQVTNHEGYYGWDVVQGCWYVVVQAEGYETRISPVVGVPPEVTDLNLALTSAVNQWAGPNDGDWNTGSNWSDGNVPDQSTNVTIPAGASLHLSGNAAAKSLTIENGATLNLSTFDLTVEQTLTLNGTMQQSKDVPSGSTTTFLRIQNQAATETTYYGVDITPATSSMGETTVAIRGNQTGCTTDPIETTLGRCHDITPTSAQNATIRFWFTEAERNGLAANALHLWHYDGPPGQWSHVGTHPADYSYSEAGTTCTSGGGNECWLEVANVSAYSPFVAASSTPLNVTLASLTAAPQQEHILVTWETVVELDNLGFNVWRGSSPDAPDTQLNASLIPSQAPGSGQGSAYEWEDTEVEAGVTYYYWLEALDVNGLTTRHGPVSATQNIPTAVTVDVLTVSSVLAGALPWIFGSLALIVLIVVRRRYLDLA